MKIHLYTRTNFSLEHLTGVFNFSKSHFTGSNFKTFFGKTVFRSKISHASKSQKYNPAKFKNKLSVSFPINALICHFHQHAQKHPKPTKKDAVFSILSPPNRRNWGSSVNIWQTQPLTFVKVALAYCATVTRRFSSNSWKLPQYWKKRRFLARFSNWLFPKYFLIFKSAWLRWMWPYVWIVDWTFLTSIKP